LATPGGWQIIGRAAVDLFTPDEASPSLLKSGDIVHFVPIREEEYIEMRGDTK
jgi:inhibitor of KinA